MISESKKKIFKVEIQSLKEGDILSLEMMHGTWYWFVVSVHEIYVEILFWSKKASPRKIKRYKKRYKEKEFSFSLEKMAEMQNIRATSLIRNGEDISSQFL